jgi:predicted Rossmann-fold nucleotide-binding protein
MRKFWFAYLAKALVVFPGGFGTLDEMFELLTLAQTHKMAKEMTIIIYGSDYWKGVINLDLLAEKGAIAMKDKELFRFADTPETAFALLREGLQKYCPECLPDERVPDEPARSAEEELGPDINETRG